MWKPGFSFVYKDQTDFGCSSKGNIQALGFRLCKVILMSKCQVEPEIAPNECFGI